jgi:hypothetical protein
VIDEWDEKEKIVRWKKEKVEGGEARLKQSEAEDLGKVEKEIERLEKELKLVEEGLLEKKKKKEEGELKGMLGVMEREMNGGRRLIAVLSTEKVRRAKQLDELGKKTKTRGIWVVFFRNNKCNNKDNNPFSFSLFFLSFSLSFCLAFSLSLFLSFSASLILSFSLSFSFILFLSLFSVLHSLLLSFFSVPSGFSLFVLPSQSFSLPFLIFSFLFVFQLRLFMNLLKFHSFIILILSTLTRWWERKKREFERKFC